MNLSNKEGQTSAEIGEGRARAKENIVPSHTRPTQSGVRVSQGLSGVRQVARERRQEQFTALLHHVSVDLLRDSFYALQRKAAPGVDGVGRKYLDWSAVASAKDTSSDCTACSCRRRSGMRWRNCSNVTRLS